MIGFVAVLFPKFIVDGVKGNRDWLIVCELRNVFF